MKTITIGGETLEISDEMLAKIREEQKPKEQKPKEWYTVSGYGSVAKASVYSGYFDHNMVFDTQKQAEAQVKRMKGAVRRYLPKRDEWYKTVDFLHWRVNTSIWRNDRVDRLLYHAGMVWPLETPDEEVKAWIKEYRAAWETV